MAGAVCDASFSQLALLLHMDGANGSSVFVDSSPSANTVTASASSGGVPTQSTSNPAFGSAALNITTVNQYLEIGVTPGSLLDLDYRSGDFTVEGWFNPSTVTACLISDSNGGGGNKWHIQVASGTQLFWTYSGSSFTGNSASTPITVGAWNSFALVCASGVMKLYLNGQGGSPVTLSGTPAATSGQINIGQNIGVAGALIGLYDEFRISRVARYTANYTPAGPFPSISCTPNVPNVVGQTTAAGVAAMAAAGYQTTVLQQNSNVVAGDIIISHAPTNGTVFPLGGNITLLVSAGPAPTAGMGGDQWGANGGDSAADNTRNAIITALSAAQQPANATYQGNLSVLAAEANSALPLTMQTPAYLVPTTPTVG